MLFNIKEATPLDLLYDLKGWKQHTEPEISNDHSTGNTDARYGDTECDDDKVTGEKEREQDCRHVYACARDLSIAFLLIEMRAYTKKKDGRIHRVNNGEKGDKRNPNPGKKSA
ncbi:MAG: hypothetical protein ABSF91_07770 [Bacteroidota bacterium]|jgi:hypothetical protein